jgi:hypothetical protein
MEYILIAILVVLLVAETICLLCIVGNNRTELLNSQIYIRKLQIRNECMKDILEKQGFDFQYFL